MFSLHLLQVLTLASTLHISEASQVCPTLVADDGIDEYKTMDRFTALRNSLDERKLIVRHIHHEHDKNNKDEYEYTIELCGDGNSTAIKQVKKSGKEGVGAVKKIGVFDGSSVLVGAQDWLFVQFKNGEKYGSHCNRQKRQGWLSVRCEDRGEKPQLRVIEEAIYKTPKKGAEKKDKLCYYLFEYNHPAACSAKGKSGLSGGSIFCIIVVVLFSCYFIFGFAFQRFVLRASGMEQIPHYSFWRKLGNSLADGCDFVCRTDDNTTTTQENVYKGITDDLDMDSDEDRDEGMLQV